MNLKKITHDKMKKVLVGTIKPFAPAAVAGIKKLIDEAGYEFHLLEKYPEQSDFVKAVHGMDALIIRSDKVTSEVLGNADQLKIVVRAGAGYDNVDLDAATKQSVVVMNTPGQNSNAVAELAIGMMLFHARNRFNGTSGTELRGKKLGIHAVGHVGQLVAKIAIGIGMEVYGYDPFIESEKLESAGIKPVATVEELYSSCQYISLHIPSTPETKKSIDKRLLNMMPQGAVLVNTARKEVIHEDEILEVMEHRPDFAYLSDIAPDCSAVFNEKYTGRFFFTPKKMGAQTAEANINAGIAAAEQIIAFFEKGDRHFQVNK